MELVVKNTNPWIAVKCFSLKIHEIRDFLMKKGLNVFLPEQYVEVEDVNSHHVKQVLKPVTHNLIFVEEPVHLKEFATYLTKCPYKMSVVRPYPTADTFARISAREMKEFEEMCNPKLTMKYFLSEDEAKLKSGGTVQVTHGPLKGMSGRLVRKSKKYFLLKDMPGISVMIKVSRWCCKPIEHNNIDNNN